MSSPADAPKPAPFMSALRELTPSEIAEGFTNKHGFTNRRKHDELQKLRDQAAIEGHREGYNDGLRIGADEGRREAFETAFAEYRVRFEKEYAAGIGELDRLAGAMREAMAQWFENAEKELANVAVLIAEQVIGNELATNPDVTLEIAKQALKEVTHASEATIRVSPRDVEGLRARLNQLLSAGPSLKHLVIQEDPSIHGGCVIDSEGGVVVATIDDRLRAIAQGALRTS